MATVIFKALRLLAIWLQAFNLATYQSRYCQFIYRDLTSI